jgi:hypothetical protein
MGKIVFWLVVVFVVLLGLRLLNVANAKRRRDEAAGKGRPASGGDHMVRCVRCGLYLPQAEAKSSAAGYVCADGRCADRR